MPVFCLQGKDSILEGTGTCKGTFIHQGDKIAQFRIMEVMPDIEFVEVDTFNNEDRGGFGSTGDR